MAPLPAYGCAGKTTYFRVEEWCSRHPLAEPYPVEWVEERWRPLAEMLDVVREATRGPLRVTPNGGYRCIAHNFAVAGKTRSQHLEGRAADIVSETLSAKALHYLLLRLWRQGALPALGGLGFYERSGFVHVDTRPKERNVLARWSQAPDEEQAA